MQRFISKIKIIGTCWVWQACSRGNGYGCIKINGKVVDAHRFSYEFFIAPIPLGKLVCHSCDNRLCVNPNHLFLGTHADNTADAISKHRHVLPVNRARGQSHGFAKLKDKDIPNIFRMFDEGIAQTDIAKTYGVDKSTVCRILKRKAWMTITA